MEPQDKQAADRLEITEQDLSDIAAVVVDARRRHPNSAASVAEALAAAPFLSPKFEVRALGRRALRLMPLDATSVASGSGFPCQLTRVAAAVPRRSLRPWSGGCAAWPSAWRAMARRAATSWSSLCHRSARHWLRFTSPLMGCPPQQQLARPGRRGPMLLPHPPGRRC